LGLHPAVQAAPAPVFCSLDQVRPQGITLDVAASGEEVLVALDRERFEPALVHVAASPGVPLGVPPLGVGQSQPANESRELSVLPRPDNQVPVIGHDAVGQQPCSRAIDGLFQDPLKRLVVLVFLKDRHPRVGAIEDMVDQATVIRSFRSAHVAKATKWPSLCPGKVPDTFLLLHFVKELFPTHFLLKEKRTDTNNLNKLLEVRRVLAEQTSNRRRSLPSNSAELFLSGGPVAHRETPCIRSRDPARAIEVPRGHGSTDYGAEHSSHCSIAVS